MSARSALLIIALLAVCGRSALASDIGETDRALLARSLTDASAADLVRASDLPFCRIDATYDRDLHRITARQSLRMVNRSDQPLSDLAFHTYANAVVYHGASMTITSATVDGTSARCEEVRERTAVLVTLPGPLAPGAQADIVLAFTCTLSTTGGNYGLLASNDAVDCLYGWHPEPAVRRDGRWQLHPVGEQGDPTQNEMFHAVVSLTLPSGLQLMNSGSQVGDSAGADGSRTVVVASAFTRNVVLVIGSGFESLKKQVGDTEVVSWFHPDDQAGGKSALDTAADSLAFFEEHLGLYPYRDLDVVEVRLGPNVGGMESTGLVLIERGSYAAMRMAGDTAGMETMPSFMMATIVSHEVAHQWWYNLVGSDSFLYPWVDESLTNWTGCWYLEQRGGPISRAGGWQMCYMECASVPRARTIPINLAADAYSLLAYGGIVYGRGALMYQALRKRVGDDAFVAFLRGYHERFRYGYVRESDLLATVGEALGEDIAAWFRATWIEGDGLTQRDIMEASKPLPRR